MGLLPGKRYIQIFDVFSFKFSLLFNVIDIQHNSKYPVKLLFP